MGTLADTLHEFHAAVEDYRKRSPHLRAYAKMLEAAEEADRILGPDAAGVWEEVLRAVPGDPLAEHHLAIIRHGTGYRLHAESPKNAPKAAEEWKRGMQHWARLVNSDAFWDGLRKTWEERATRTKGKAGADPIGEKLLKLDLRKVRAHLPRPLLALHAGFAEDCAATDPKMAKLHVSAIKESGFHPTAVEAARKRVYRSVAGDVVKLAADLNVDEAWAKLRKFLAIDPDFPAALADALRICADDCGRRAGDPEQFEALLKMLREAEGWAEDPALVAAARDEFPLAVARADFYLAWTRLCGNRGIDLCNKEKHGEGLKLIGQAFDRVQTCMGATINRSLEVTRAFLWICTNGVLIDTGHNREAGRFPLAERILKVGLGREPNDPVMHALNANYCYWTGNERGFRDALERAEQLNRQTPSSEANSLLPNLRQFLARGMGWGRVLATINRAIKAGNAGNFHEALRIVKEAEKIDPNVLSVQLNKCYYSYRVSDRATAVASFHKAEGLVTPDTPQDSLNELEQLRGFLFGR